MALSTDRSAALLRSVGRLLRRDRSLFAYAGLLAGALFLFAVAWIALIAWLSPERQGVVLLLVFIFLAGLSSITAFFRTAVVHATRAHLGGQPIDVSTALEKAQTHVPVLAQWALLSATVALVLGARESHGWMGALPQLAWWATTAFVLPAVVYKGLGLVEAIQESVRVLERTWVEVATGGFALIVARSVLVFLGLVLLTGAIATGSNVIWQLLLGAYLVTVISLSEVIEQIYQTLIYDWITTGKDPAPASQANAA